MKQSAKKTATVLGAAGATMAAAAGAYYLYGSEKAAQHRRQVAAWMRRAEREIVHEAKRLKTAAYTDETIRNVIGEVAKRYEAARNLDPQDVRDFIAAVHTRWKEAGSVVKGRTQPARGTQKRPRARKKASAKKRG